MTRSAELIREYDEIVRLEHQAAAKTDPVRFANLLSVLNPITGKMETLKPDPWQERVLRSKHKRILLNCCRQAGKRLWTDTPIATPQGWTTMGAIAEGDEVFDERGTRCRVTWAGPTETALAYRVTFHNGDSILADAEHLWTTVDGPARRAMTCVPRKRRPASQSVPDDWATWKSRGERGHPEKSKGAITRTTAEIARTMTMHTRGDTNHSIPTCRPLELPHVPLDVDPYVLGVWLGDGNANDGRVTLSDEDAEVLDYVRDAGHAVVRQATSSVTPNWAIRDLRHRLRTIGVLNNKHIPTQYMRASVAQRIALLQGLMDTDGHAPLRSSTNFCEFCNTNRRLSQGVAELAVSLGFVVSSREGRATLNGVDCGPKYRIFFSPTLVPFRLKRKAERVSFDRRPSLRRQRFITKIEPAIQLPMRCISVDSPSNLYLAGESMIPTHNSTTAAVKAAHTAMFNQRALVLIIAPSQRQSQETFRKVQDFFGSITPRPAMPTDSKTELELINGSRVISLPSNDQRIRGFSAATLIIEDEAGDVEDELHQAILPMLIISKGSMILMGTPKGRRGHFYRHWVQEGSGWEPYEVPWSACPRIDPADIVRERVTLREAFPQEYENKFIQAGGGLVYGAFDEATNLVRHLPEGQWSYLLSIDFGFVDSTAFCIIGWLPHDQTVYVVLSFKEPGLHPSQVGEKVQELEATFKFTRIIGDIGGLGKGYAEELRRRFHIPVEAAEKQNKRGYVDLLNGDLATGKLKLLESANQGLIKEWRELPWNAERTREDQACANDLSDSALYGWRASTAYLQQPLDNATKTPDEAIRAQTKAYWEQVEAQAERAKHAGFLGDDSGGVGYDDMG